MLARSEGHAPQHWPNSRGGRYQPVVCDTHSEEQPPPQIVSSCDDADHEHDNCNKMFSYRRDRATGCVIVLAKSGRLELGDNNLRTL